MRKRSLLLVEWEDSCNYHSWCEEEETRDVTPMICYTVGWKVKAPKGKLMIASSRNSVGECADRTTIPKANVKSIRRLE